VQNPGLEELPSPLGEAESPVETRRLNLRVEHGARHRAAARALEHRVKQRRPDPLSAPILQHRHAPDASVG